MKIERNELFRELTPPEGGAARLRARLSAELSNAARTRVHIMPLSRTFPQALRDFATLGVAAVLLLAVLAAIGLVTAPPLDPGSIDGNRIAGGEALQRSELYASADLDRLLGRPSMPFELTVSLGDERLELIEIPTRDPRVRIVRVEESLAN
jgi:hypothetical protein